MTDTQISEKPVPKQRPARGPIVARRLAQIHRWIGIVLGAQVFLWMISGVIMSWFSITLVRGETTKTLNLPIELSSYNYVAPGGILARSEGATNLSLKIFLGDAVYVTKGNGQNNMFNALTGEKISPLRKEQAIQVANLDYAGDAPIQHAHLLTKPPKEFRGPVPVWQIAFKDNNKTRLYISPYDGTVISRRNRIWRLYDFFWMLHIMDYDERDNFNNPLIRAASATGLLFALSGIGLIVLRLRHGRYFNLRRRRDDD